MENLINVNKKFNGVIFKNKFFEFLDVSSNETIRTYRNGIGNFMQYLFDNGISLPNRESVVAWKTSLKETSSSSTVNTYLVAVKAFFNFLEMYGMYPNVSKYVKGYKVSATPKKNVLTQEQIKTIYNGLTDLREKALFGLLITTGMRGVEVSNAKIENLKMVNGEYVLYIKCKGHTEYDEYVKIADNIMEDLVNYIGDRTSGHIFTSTSNHNTGNGVTTLTIRRIIKAIFKRFGIDDETISLHSTRRTFACVAYNNGASIYEIQQVLHHVSITTSQRYLKQADRDNNSSEKTIANILACN